MTERNCRDQDPRVDLEHRVIFRDAESWTSWVSAHPSTLSPEARASAVALIKAQGITAHPLGHSVPPEDVRVSLGPGGDVLHFRETGALRAALAAFIDSQSEEPEYARRRLKILAVGLLPRHLGPLRRKQPFITAADEYDLGQVPTGRGFDLVLGSLMDASRQEIEKRMLECVAQLGANGRLLLSAPFTPDAASDKTSANRLTWSLMLTLRHQGFQQIDVIWYSSRSRGILGIDNNGTFVIDARRRPTTSEADRAAPQRGLIALIGLPRSGTTLLTALLGAHSDIHAIYEPWNSRRTRFEAYIARNEIQAVLEADPFDLSIEAFRSEIVANTAINSPWLLVKETTTAPEYADAIEGLLCKPPTPPHTHLIWLVRSPFHVYLSEIEARKKWWGASDLEHSKELFERWARRSLRSFQRLLTMSRRFAGLIVSYEALARDTLPTLRTLMQRMDIPFQASQLSYYKTLKPTAVMGDLSLATNPREVSDQSLISRQEQFEALRHTISASPAFARIASLSHWVDGLALKGVMAASDAYTDELGDLLRSPA